nr:tyrosine-type recombinase/integrase [Aquabacterium terrae]
MGLNWNQIDMPRQMMTVAARDIKSRKTLRIPLNATAMEILRGQIGKHLEYVFLYKGRPLSATVNMAWRNALKKSGIETSGSTIRSTPGPACWIGSFVAVHKQNRTADRRSANSQRGGWGDGTRSAAECSIEH